uniref:UDP-N-acetylglucosamine/UDP-glucose/GDP-mannose transporter n=1 Tax=Jaculus jaculus TaxID=51337 RepID=UPI001E1B42CE|nr:UDP-N-acetylglucosamine/UDP-glucose/GDP-mannose transporter [Jaculus jaculus]
MGFTRSSPDSWGAARGGGPGSGVRVAALPVPAAPSSRRAGPQRAGGRGMTAEGAGAGAEPSRLARLLSALFYGTCSFLLVLVNKALLTTYGFPSPLVLGIGQMAATVMILYVSKLNKIIHFPDFDKKIPIKLFPLPLLYVGNHISGLSSTRKLSLPMFTVLRKFTIPLTLLLEAIILGRKYSLTIVASVFTIVLGAVVAAGSDLTFNLEGYILVFLNDIFTAANGVYTKQKMDPKELGKYGVLFYNACFMILPTLTVSVCTGDLQQATEFNQWKDILFIIQFLLSCFLGFLLMYSTVLCSYYNSALTTAVVGAIKNVSVAYIGMLVGGDYIFSLLNFVGLNICMAGGLRYSFLTLSSQFKPKPPVDEENVPVPPDSQS